MTKPKELPPLEVLEARFSYNPETGDLTRKVSSRLFKAGEVVTSTHRGYLVVSVGNRQILAHRVCWLLHYKTIDNTLYIDHINRDRSDNRIVNLRQVPQRDNTYNIPRRKDNISGHTGVGYVKPRGRYKGGWRARLSGGHIGFFNTLEEAIEARQKAIEERGIVVS